MKGFRHFLEVFDPNRPEAVEPGKIPEFINDAIVRTLGGVTSKGRPLFLKMVYHGPRAMEELVHYDPHLVVGILGGSAGTTYDAFKLLSEARKYGARIALFGRKINNAENQLAFIHFLRYIASGDISAEEAVRGYHGVLQKLGIKPHRSLEEDMQLQTGVMNYGGSGTVVSLPPVKKEAGPTPKKDPKSGRLLLPRSRTLGRMSPAEKWAYNKFARGIGFWDDVPWCKLPAVADAPGIASVIADHWQAHSHRDCRVKFI